jgi:hypothetical protein
VTGFLWLVLGLVGTLAMTAVSDMVSEEVRDRLDHLPQAILWLAARRLGPEQRVIVYEEDWLPELAYILKGDEARPVTRLYHGTRFALGILVSAGRIAAARTVKAPAQLPRISDRINHMWRMAFPQAQRIDYTGRPRGAPALQSQRPESRS